MTSKWWTCLCRLAVYVSLINVVLVSVLLLRHHSCVFLDCVVRREVHRYQDEDVGRSNTYNNSCYDNDVAMPTEVEEMGRRRYNCLPPRFSAVPLTATALTSSPGSGSTWIRHLLQLATGIYTGSVYYDSDLANDEFPGENVTDSRVVVINTHRERELLKYDRAILIIRDPYDAIVSEYNWRVCGNHLGRAHSHVYNATAWRQFVNTSAEHWHRFNSKWLDDFQGPMQVVFFEDMVKDLAMQLRNIIAFLDLPDSRTYCALRSPNGNFKRKPTNVLSRGLFTYAERTTIDGYQESVYESVTQQQMRLRIRMLQ